jgi:uncharacterized protein YbdZ (MbtH family)
LWSAVRTLTSANPPGIPVLTLPGTNALVMTYAPVLDWGDAVPGLDHYQVQVATSSSFGAIVEDELPTGSTHTVSPDLSPNTTYWWRVRSFNAGGQYSLWSALRTFRTVILTPSLVAPTDTEVLLTTRPTFVWGSVAGASNYTLNVSTSPTFSPLAVNTTVAPSTYTMTSDLGPKGVAFYWRVRANATNGPSLWSAVRTLTSANPPGIPVLTLPASNALVMTYAPVLDWADAVPGLDHYQVQIASNSTFTSIVQDALPIGSTYTASPDLNPNTTYWWRVRSFNAGGQYSLWSGARTFRTVILIPSLVAPTEAEVLLTTRPTFDWGDVPGASTYTLNVSMSPTFSPLTVNTSVTPSTYTMTADLSPKGVVMYWRVRANGPNGPSLWSAVRTLTSANPPGIPALTLPASNALVLTTTPLLDWGDTTPGLDHYQLQIATNSTFSSPVQDVNVSGSSYVVSPALNNTATYWWRVRSLNAAGQYSLWSAVRTFRTAIAPPTLVSPADGSETTNRRPTFDWSDVPGATSDTLQVATNNLFTTFIINVSPSASTYTMTVDLPLNKVLDWRVRANGPNGPSAWSPVWSFLVVP